MGQQLRPLTGCDGNDTTPNTRRSTLQNSPDDIRDDLPKIRAIVDIAERVLDNMSVY